METNNPFGVSSSGRRTPFDSDYSEDELDFTTSSKGNSRTRKKERRRKLQDKKIREVAIQINREAVLSKPISVIDDEESVTLVDPPSESSSSSSEEEADDAMSSVSTPSRKRGRRRRRRRNRRDKNGCSKTKIDLNCFERYFFNTAPGLFEIVSRGGFADFFLNVVLRSVGQVTFCDNPWSGALVLLGMLAGDFDNMCGPMLYGVFAVVIANLTAWSFNVNYDLMRHGLFGFNAFLVGLGVSIFLETGVLNRNWAPDYPVLFGTIVSAILVIPVQLCLGKIISKVLDPNVPALTLPFNAMLIMFLFDSERNFSIRTVNQALIKPSQISFYDVPLNQTEFRGEQLVEGVFKGLGEIYISNSSVFSIFVVASIFVYSRIGSALAVYGSILGYVASAALGASNFSTKIGLWGYNPALTAMAVGGVFAVPSMSSLVLCSVASFLTQVIWAANVQMFTPWGLPVCTIPFCLATLTLFAIRKDVSNRVSWIQLAHVTTPEEHLRKWGHGKKGIEGLCE